MKSKTGNYLIAFVIGMIVMYLLKGSSTEYVEVPVAFEVEVPVVEVEHDTIYKPKPYAVKEADTTLIAKYRRANDSLKEQLYQSSTKTRQYREVFEDSIQTITVDASVKGTLNHIVASYKTKPRFIPVDTTVTFKVPSNFSVLLYGEMGIPTQLDLSSKVIIKGGLDMITKDNWIFGGSFDTNKTAWGKVGKRFNF